MEEQKNINWLEEELEQTKSSSFDNERLPALKLEENKIALIEIDFITPFDTWKSDDGAVKKIIPVTFKGEKLVWWLNVRNPIYHQLLQRGLKGQKIFKVLQTGNKNTTKYTLIED